MIYIVVKRRESDAVFLPSFTICQIALCIMPGSFRYREAILLKRGKNVGKIPAELSSNVWVLPVACSVRSMDRGTKRESHLLVYSS